VVKTKVKVNKWTSELLANDAVIGNISIRLDPTKSELTWVRPLVHLAVRRSCLFRLRVGGRRQPRWVGLRVTGITAATAAGLAGALAR
jgi:hypothetical protein